MGGRGRDDEGFAVLVGCAEVGEGVGAARRRGGEVQVGSRENE